MKQSKKPSVSALKSKVKALKRRLDAAERRLDAEWAKHDRRVEASQRRVYKFDDVCWKLTRLLEKAKDAASPRRKFRGACKKSGAFKYRGKCGVGR